MGLRFKKSIKVAPGVKINLGKKSAGISLGGKYSGVSFNTRSGTRARVSAPGTGISYSTKIDGQKASGSVNANPSKHNTDGCLIVCLKIFAYLMLAGLFIAFGWVAGIVWFIFYRKKLNDNPQKQKRMSILIGAGSVLSFIIMIISVITAPPTPNAITLSSNVEGQKLQLGEEYIFTASVSPDDANISSLKFVIDRTSRATIVQDIELPTQAVLQPQSAGTINVHVESGDIESNTLTFEIVEQVDATEATEIPETEPVEEILETETAESENTTSSESTSDVTTELPQTQQQEQPPAQEQAPMQEQTPQQPPAQEQTPQQPPAQEQTPQQPPAQNSQSSTLVWVDDTAAKYHKKNGCGMNNAYQVSIDRAIAMGKEPCGRCY